MADTVAPKFISSRITTSDGDDNIEGGAADDVIFGGGGNDKLSGNDGDDVIIGDGGRFEYTRTEVGRGTSHVSAGIRLELAGSHAHANPLHMNQDGVIR
ncbi:hypothetical protein D3C83_63680 [compost metagenome]